MAAAKKAKIELYKSIIGADKRQKATVEALGFKRSRRVVEKEMTPAIVGMVNSIPHLVRIVEEK
jgi:large subunit ribosomal protein L30